MENLTGLRKDIVKPADMSGKNESERPLPSQDLIRQKSFEMKTKELEKTLAEKTKEHKELDTFYHSLKKLRVKQSRNKRLESEIEQYIEKMGQDLQYNNKLNESIKNLCLEFEDNDLNRQIELLKKYIPSKKARKAKTSKLEKTLLDMLVSHHKSLKKEIKFINENKLQFTEIDKNTEIDLKRANKKKREKIKEVHDYMNRMGIEIKIDWDSHFGQVSPIKIGSIHDCEEKILEILDESRSDRIDTIQSEIDRAKESAQSQVEGTRVWVNYFQYVQISRALESLRKDLSLAIQPISGQERLQTTDLEANILQESSLNKSEGMRACANNLIKMRKTRETIESEAKNKIDDLLKENNLGIQIVECCFDMAIQVRKDLEQEKINDQQVEEIHKKVVQSCLRYSIANNISVTELPGYSEVHQFYEAMEKELWQRNEVVYCLNEVEEEIKKKCERCS